MKLNKVQAQDIEALYAIASQTVQGSVTIDAALQDELIAHIHSNIAHNITQPDSVFLTAGDDHLLAYILVQHYWNLSDLFVLPEAQGLGVGRKLLETALSTCFAQSSYVRVNSSLNAEAFYRRHGFVDFIAHKNLPNYVVPLICYAR